MVNEKTVPLMLQLAIPPQGSGDGLTFLPGVNEYQTLLAPGMLVDIANTGVCIPGCFRSPFLQNGKRVLDILPLSSLDILYIEVFHTQTPLAALGLDLRNDCSAAGAQGQEFSGTFRIADGGRQTDAPGIDTGHTAEAFNEAKGLSAPVAPEQGMHLVDHHKAQIAEEPGNCGVFVEEYGLQRFRCDLQNPGGMLYQPAFVALGHIPMPVPDRDIRFRAKVIQPGELVVDQCLQRPHIDTANGSRRILGKQGYDREEGGFRLTGGGGRSQKHILIGIKDRIRRSHLNGTQVLPAVAVDILLNKGSIAVKCTHKLPLTN